MFSKPPSKCNCRAHDLVQAPDGSGSVYFKKPVRPKIPADPISISIAMRAAQRSTVDEGIMDYGFNQKFKRPIDQPTRKLISPIIDEEKLFNMNAKVIEFKRPKYSEEDEFADSDEEFGSPRKSKKVVSNPSYFYYSDIGYSDVQNNNQKFVNVPISTTPSPESVTFGPEYMGRIIDVPEDENSYREQIMAEYARQCPCSVHNRDAFTR